MSIGGPFDCYPPGACPCWFAPPYRCCRDSDAGFAGDRNGLHPEGAAARARRASPTPFPKETSPMTPTEPSPKAAGELADQVRLFPEAYDILTTQELRDAKGNWRSLIDQQTNALAVLRSLVARLRTPEQPDRNAVLEEAVRLQAAKERVQRCRDELTFAIEQMVDVQLVLEALKEPT